MSTNRLHIRKNEDKFVVKAVESRKVFPVGSGIEIVLVYTPRQYKRNFENQFSV